MLEKLNEFNQELAQKLNNREFEVVSARTYKCEDTNWLDIWLKIEETEFLLHATDTGILYGRFVNVSVEDVLKTEEKEALVRHLWSEGASFITSKNKQELKDLTEILKKIA